MRTIFLTLALWSLAAAAAHAEPLACMSVSDLKKVTLNQARSNATMENLKEQIKAHLQLESIYKEKSSLCEQHTADQEQIIDAQAAMLSREQRLSRYKSEFVGLAAAAALALVW